MRPQWDDGQGARPLVAPYLRHRVLPDGSIYSQLQEFYLVNEIVVFALKSLGLDIRQVS